MPDEKPLELRSVKRGDVPAPPTEIFIRETNKSMTEFSNRMTKVEDKIDNVGKNVDEIKETLKRLEAVQYERDEKFQCFAREEHTKIYDRMRLDKKEIEDRAITNKKEVDDNANSFKNLVIGGFILVVAAALVISYIIDKFNK